MPIVNGDVSGLEVVVAAELSGDVVLSTEIKNKENIHTNNQVAFNLPSRLIAKVFKFRLIYGGSAYSYANDPDFMEVSSSEKYWQKVIDAYYEKYSGVAKWHTGLLNTVREQGYIEIPSGRRYFFEPERKWNGLQWPLTTIKNYPVQGFGADLVMLARIEAWKQFKASGMEGRFIGTIHDSLVYDVPKENVDATAKLLFKAIEDVPKLCKETFGYEFSLPLTSEIQVGNTKGSMEEYKWD